VSAVVLVVAACAFIPLIGRDETGALALDPDWIAGLWDFYRMVYQTGYFQVLMAMLVLGLALEAVLPARRQRSAGALNVPFGAMMLLLVSATTPLPVLTSQKRPAAICTFSPGEGIWLLGTLTDPPKPVTFEG
jgi:hypothetical protein